MVKKSFADIPCSLAQALDVIGEWWTLLIVRDFFLGNGTRRFEQLRDSLGISRNILTERLKTLTDEGVIERIPLQEGGKRCAYQLTPKGRDLLPVLVSIMQWQERWENKDESTAGYVGVCDRGTGEAIAPIELRNREGRALDLSDLYLTVSTPSGEFRVLEWPIKSAEHVDDIERASS